MKHVLKTNGSVHEGYILLISVLVIGSIASLILVSLLMLGGSANQVGFAVEQATQSLAGSQACAEYAMQELRTSLSYAGNQIRTLNLGTCEIMQIGGTGNNNRLICIESQVGDTIRRLEIVVSQVLPETKIDSWQEVSKFSLCL